MLDLYKGFKKVAEDEKSATLEHEQGHRITLAKGGLAKKQRQLLNKLPLHLAEGGAATKEESSASDKLKGVGAQIAEAVAAKVVEGAEQSISPQQIEQMPEPVATDVATGVPVAKGAGSAPQDQQNIIAGEPGMRAISNQPPTSPMEVALKGLEPGQGVKSVEELQRQIDAEKADKANIAQKIEQQNTQQEQQQLEDKSLGETVIEAPEQMQPQAVPQMIQPAPVRPARVIAPMTPEQVLGSSKTTASQKMLAYQQMIQKTMEERRRVREEFAQRVKERKFEPKGMYGEDTGKNILTVVSLLLGGMAGGLLHQENPALKIINDEIERDLLRQKENMASEDNLYKENLNMLGDEVAAYTQSMNQMRQIALMQMEEMMGRAYDPSNPMMALNMQAEAAKLRAQIDSSDMAVAKRQQKEKILQALESSRGISKMDPSTIVPVLDVEAADKAKIFEEIKDRQTIAATMPEILRLFEQTQKENRAFYGILPKPTTFPIPFYGQIKRPDSAKALEALLTPLIKTQGPAREPEMRRVFDALVPAPFDSEEDQVLKRNALKQFITTVSATPVSKAYGLDLNKFESTNFVAPEDSQKRQFLEYAQKNINSSDPSKKQRAQKILELYGQ